MKLHRLSAATTALLALVSAESAADAAGRRTYSVSGAAHVTASTGLNNPYTLLVRPDVQDIATEALAAPISGDRLAALLRNSEVKLENLLETNLLEPTGDGRYKLATTVLTVEDRKLIDRISDPMGRSLAGAFLKERAAFDRILASYDLPGIDPETVRMALIGCVILDWDGLGVTADENYRTTPTRHANGDRFQMVLRESSPDISPRSLYWGSSTFNVANNSVWTTTFGDHHPSSQRVAFPDLVGVVDSDDMLTFVKSGLALPARRAVAEQLASAMEAKLGEMQEVAGPLMIALRNGPADVAALSRAVGKSPEQTKAVLDLLEALQYVEEDGGKYRAAIPVFTQARDGAMIQAYRQLGKQVMSRWLRANYADAQRQFSTLAAARAGVPFKVMFTELWHPIFGWANYHLVKQGYLHDPYGPNAKFVSFVPFVWDAPLKMEEGTRIFD